MTNPQYSEKELKLIKQLGYMDLSSVEPIALYRIIAMNLCPRCNKTHLSSFEIVKNDRPRL